VEREIGGDDALGAAEIPVPQLDPVRPDRGVIAATANLAPLIVL
jgi:hypothetical protein